MALPSFAQATLVIQRAPTGVTDGHGNSHGDWSSPSTHRVAGCSVQPGGGGREQDGRDAVRADLTVYAPPGTDVRGTDRVLIPGYPRPFEIQGEPQVWQSPSGRVSHIELTLTVWEG